MSLIIPETIFLNTLKAILKLVRTDFANQVNESDTILYKIMHDSGALERYDMYVQTKKIIITKVDDPRAFDVNMFFNMNRVSVPTLHITVPSENTGQDGIGLDEGFQDSVFNDEDQTYHKVYTRRFDTTYSFVITSDNSNEVIALYHFVRALDIALINHFNLSGLEKIRISGGDVNINQALVPQNIFIRNIAINFSYEVSVQELFTTDFVTKLIFAMQPPIIGPQQVDESDSISV